MIAGLRPSDEIAGHRPVEVLPRGMPVTGLDEGPRTGARAPVHDDSLQPRAGSGRDQVVEYLTVQRGQRPARFQAQLVQEALVAPRGTPQPRRDHARTAAGRS